MALANKKSLWIGRVVALTLLCVPAFGAEESPVSYFDDVRPVIQRACQGCHQPATKMGGLVLTSYPEIVKGGQRGPIFKEGSPAESPLIGHLTGEKEPRMPMGQDPLPTEEIELFRRWVREGARDDTPESAKGPKIPDQPPVYQQPPVISGLAYSPDGSLLAVGGFKEILLHKSDGSGIVSRLLGKSDRLNWLGFTPDGKTLVAVGGSPATFGELQVWDVESRQLSRSLIVGSDTLFGGSLSADGRYVCFGTSDKTVRVVEVATGEELFKAGHHEDWVLGTAFGIDDERIVSVGRDRAAKLANAKTGAFIENVNLLRDQLYAIARHPRRDYVLIGGKDRVPYLYMMDRPAALVVADDSTLVKKYEEQTDVVQALAFSPDGNRFAVGGLSDEVPVYDTESGERVATCAAPGRGVFAIVFHPTGGPLAIGGFEGRLRVCDPTSGEMVKEFVPVPLEKLASTY